jgi:MFS family permease
VSKPFFALAAAPAPVFAARFMDRIGKGIRGSPRDALVADVTPPEMRGRAYGLRQALDTAGAFLGPLLAIALMALFADDMRKVFWAALAPAAIAVLLAVYGVGDRAAAAQDRVARPPLRLIDLRQLPGSFWSVVAIGVLFTLARFSEAFLVLKAVAEGLPIALAPLTFVVMNAVYMLCAYPAGAWSDRAPARIVLLWGLGALIAADLVLAFAPGVSGAFAGIVLWGAHMALSQGLFAKMVADIAPERLRGSAFGLFHLVTGLALLVANIVAGLLWETLGASATFLAGGGFALVAGAMLALRRAS